MKKIAKIFFLLALLTAGFSCKDDSAENPVFGPDEVYLYDGKPATMAATKDVLTELEMIVSPNDGSVNCRWLLDGAVIGTEKNLSYVFTKTGASTLRFEASRGTRTIAKNFQLTVTN